MSRKSVHAVAAVLWAVLGGALLVPGGAVAAPPSDEARTEADLDGDGRADPVTLVQVTPESMLLRVGLADRFVDATVPGNARGLAPRAVDLDADGRAEVLVPGSVGANTVTSTLWGLGPGAGLRQTTDPGGAPWTVSEGGGASAISGHGCLADHDGRQVVLVDARLDDGSADPNTYSGTRTALTVANGTATPTSVVPVQRVPRTDPLLQVDPAGCAPAD